MKKTAIMVLCAFVLAVFASVAMAAPKDVYEFTAKDKVTFNHKTHQGMTACNKCHHGQDAGKETGCLKCHSKSAAKSNKDAFHKNCIGCHKEGGKGPTKCGECHKK